MKRIQTEILKMRNSIYHIGNLMKSLSIRLGEAEYLDRGQIFGNANVRKAKRKKK